MSTDALATDYSPNRRTAALVRREDPLLREADLATISRSAGPGEHFVRTHGTVPPSRRRGRRDVVLHIDGAVSEQVTLDVNALLARPQREVSAVLECAGSGRRHFWPPPEGDPWGDGAVSCARWAGVPLVDLLDEAGVRPEASWIACHGGSSEDADGFVRGLPLAAALQPDVLVATMHEGEPLRPEHGAPLRLVVPGWYGVAWTKWLTRIEVLEHEYTGYWNTEKYVLRRPGNPDQPLTQLPCKAVVTSGEYVTARPNDPVELTGFAWSGAGPVRTVELSDDGGVTWWPSQLEPADGPWGWTRWTSRWCLHARPGRHTVTVRAIDVEGRVQPRADEVPWNVFGYGWDGRPTVVVEVSDEEGTP